MQIHRPTEMLFQCRQKLKTLSNDSKKIAQLGFSIQLHLKT